MAIGKHSERITLGVMNLGKSDLFLGHEWLHYHNPSIDWHLGSLKFNCCPFQCHQTPFPSEPEDEDEPENVKGFLAGEVTEGDRIFALDFYGYWMADEHCVRAHTTMAQQLAEEALKQKGVKSFEEQVPSCYHDFANIFSKESFNSLPECCPWDHAIELTPGDHTIDCKVYNLSMEEQRELDSFLEENLQSGHIHPSKSPFASAFFFVKKKDRRLRPVQDYHQLNVITLKNRYPLPLISELINKLKGAKYFTKLDVCWGYNNVRIKEGDEWKAAFHTNQGLFEPLIMFFGLTNSPATFQNMMNDVFRDLIFAGKMLIYLDDILIFTKTLEEHHQIVHQVLFTLRRHKLYLKPEKCDFMQTGIKYLSLIISQNQVCMDPVKTCGILDWPTPTCKRDLQSFLGFINFYRHFICDFVTIAKPLSALTGKMDWL